MIYNDLCSASRDNAHYVKCAVRIKSLTQVKTMGDTRQGNPRRRNVASRPIRRQLAADHTAALDVGHNLAMQSTVEARARAECPPSFLGLLQARDLARERMMVRAYHASALHWIVRALLDALAAGSLARDGWIDPRYEAAARALPELARLGRKRRYCGKRIPPGCEGLLELADDLLLHLLDVVSRQHA